MRTKFIGFSFATALLLISCSQGKDLGDKSTRVSPGPDNPDSGFRNDPLEVVGYTQNIFTTNSNFSAFSYAARRVTVIDVDSDKEIFGKFVSGKYTQAFSLPGLDGVGLIAPDEFKIVTRTGEKEFSIPDGSEDRWRWAPENLSFAFISQSDNVVASIRNLGEASWDETLISFPSALFEELGGVYPILSSDGLKLVLLNPVSGSYVVYEAEDATSAMKTSAVHECLVAGAATLSEYNNTIVGSERYTELSNMITDAFRSAVIDATGTSLLLATNDGKIYSFSLAGICSSASSAVSTTTTGAAAMRRIGVLSNDEIWMVAEDNQVELFNFDPTSETLTSARVYEDVCDGPFSLNELSDDYLAATCVTQNDIDTIFEGESSKLEFQAFKRSNGDALSSIEIKLDHIASLSVDPENLKLYQFLDGGLGEFKKIDLISGEYTSKKSLFVKNILDRL